MVAIIERLVGPSCARIAVGDLKARIGAQLKLLVVQVPLEGRAAALLEI